MDYDDLTNLVKGHDIKETLVFSNIYSQLWSGFKAYILSSGGTVTWTTSSLHKELVLLETKKFVPFILEVEFHCRIHSTK